MTRLVNTLLSRSKGFGWRQSYTRLSWYHAGISVANRKHRKLERRWRASRLCVDMFVDQCQVVNQILRDAKSSYYLSITSENASDPKILSTRLTSCYIAKKGDAIRPRPQRWSLRTILPPFYCNYNNEIIDMQHSLQRSK